MSKLDDFSGAELTGTDLDTVAGGWGGWWCKPEPKCDWDRKDRDCKDDKKDRHDRDCDDHKKKRWGC